MTPEEILDAVDRALEETSRRLATQKPRQNLQPLQSDKSAARGRPMTAREILDAVDKALEETSRRFADDGH
jgi:hypothetical protein